MKFSASIATLASLAAAAPGSIPSGAQPGLNVKLELQDNSKVKAVVTNSGKESIKVLKTGSILDDVPVQKASVSGSNGNVAFEGVRVYLAPEAEESAFQEIAAGESVEVTFDVAEVFDLSNGGNFDIQSSGHVRVAQGGDIKNLGSVPYESNKISASVDGAAAAQSLSSFQALSKRATVSNDCSGSRRTAVETAVRNTHDIAVKAAQAARNGPANKMVEYFESAGQSARDTVATTFERMADIYSRNGGKPDLHCSDVQNYCSSGAVAYTLPPQNTIVFCDSWFTRYTALNKACRQVDQAHIAVHEATHLSLTKGTEDYNTYGYENSVALPARQNLNHADTYAYFAHDTLSGC